MVINGRDVHYRKFINEDRTPLYKITLTWTRISTRHTRPRGSTSTIWGLISYIQVMMGLTLLEMNEPPLVLQIDIYIYIIWKHLAVLILQDFLIMITRT